MAFNSSVVNCNAVGYFLEMGLVKCLFFNSSGIDV